jgi:hypothetical protein
MQSYAIKPTATPILSAALWLRRPLGGRKASRTLPSSLPRRAPNWRELRRLGTGTLERLRPGRCPSAQDCAERARSLAQRINELRGRASELEEATAGEPSLEVSESRLEEIVPAFREALETGSPAQRKARIKTLVAEIRLNGAEAFPFYRLPAAGVRIVGTLVEPARAPRRTAEQPPGRSHRGQNPQSPTPRRVRRIRRAGSYCGNLGPPKGTRTNDLRLL